MAGGERAAGCSAACLVIAGDMKPRVALFSPLNPNIAWTSMQYSPSGPISAARHRMGAMARGGIGTNPDIASNSMQCPPFGLRRAAYSRGLLRVHLSARRRANLEQVAQRRAETLAAEVSAAKAHVASLAFLRCNMRANPDSANLGRLAEVGFGCKSVAAKAKIASLTVLRCNFRVNLECCSGGSTSRSEAARRAALQRAYCANAEGPCRRVRTCFNGELT